MKALRQRGLTLIELMVAMAVGLAIVLAAAAALSMSTRGFSALDAAAQLRDNGRFAAAFIQRLALQSNYTEVENLRVTGSLPADPDTPTGIEGFDNALIGTNSAPYAATHGSRSAKCPASDGTACANGSDILILRYQPGKGSAADVNADGTMINCVGAGAIGALIDDQDRVTSILYVAKSPSTGNEPALMCQYQDNKTGAWVAKGEPMVDGVESFQVLYGVNGVAPNTVSAAAASDQPDFPTRYLRADQMVVAGNDLATMNNWRRVRSLRIGLVLRGPLNSALEQAQQKFYPLGKSMASAADVQSEFVAANDGRLRSVVTFTVHLRNYQGL